MTPCCNSTKIGVILTPLDSDSQSLSGDVIAISRSRVSTLKKTNTEYVAGR